MAEKQAERGTARKESMLEFVARRARETASGGFAAGAKACDAAEKTIRNGQDYRLMTPRELVALGAGVVERSKPRPAASPTPASRPKPRSLDDNSTAKAVGGTVAYAAGLVPGAVRSGVHTLQGAGDAALLGLRLVNPGLDRLISPPGQSASDQVMNAGQKAIEYTAQRVEDPTRIRDDLASGWRDFRVNHDPTATPVADTTTGEMKRMFALGMNGGELLADGASLAVGGAALRGAAGLGRVAKAADAVELAHLAENPGLAASLARRYPKRGMSHHIVERTAPMPKVLGGGLYPRAFIESEFNKIRHTPDMSVRDVHRNHNGAGGGKSHFGGGKIPAEFGGGNWRTEDLGWGAYGPIDRLNYGTSPYTKGVVGSVLVGGEIGKGLERDAP